MFTLISTFFSSFVISKIFEKYTYLKKKETWYYLHTIFNFFIVKYTFNDFVNTFYFKEDIIFNREIFNSRGLEIAIGLHLFHIFQDYKGMDFTDWCHHLISCFMMGTIGFYNYHNPVFNSGIFFMCGLPGGIDYLLLFLVKLNMVDKITEKKINVFLNNWIRSPGILYSCAVMHYGYMTNKVILLPYVYYLSQILVATNAIYFAEKVSINYGIHK